MAFLKKQTYFVRTDWLLEHSLKEKLNRQDLGSFKYGQISFLSLFLQNNRCLRYT